jgi:inhibitor of KinA
MIPAGDAMVILSCGEVMSLGIAARCHAMANSLRQLEHPAIRGVAVGRSSVAVHFDPLLAEYEEIRSTVEELVLSGIEVAPLRGVRREIPVTYGGEYGPDLETVARYHRISPDEVVRLQSGAEYSVVALASPAGLPQMMGLPPQLVLPRRRQPRRVPAGSVLIAAQTIVMPFEGPTGWWWIGATTEQLFDASDDPPALLRPGDTIVFVPNAMGTTLAPTARRPGRASS